MQLPAMHSSALLLLCLLHVCSMFGTRLVLPAVTTVIERWQLHARQDAVLGNTVLLHITFLHFCSAIAAYDQMPCKQDNQICQMLGV